MTSVKYIGLDVHKESISICVRNFVGKVIASPSRTQRQSKTLCLEKTALRVRDYAVGLNAETKKDRHRAAGETFVLTFPLIGLYR